MPELERATRCGNACVEIYLDLNKLSRAAKEMQAVADCYKTRFSREKDEKVAETAIGLYKKCHDLYRKDGKSRAAARSGFIFDYPSFISIASLFHWNLTVVAV